MSVSHTLLGVLLDAPAHGYSIRKRLEEMLSPNVVKVVAREPDNAFAWRELFNPLGMRRVAL